MDIQTRKIEFIQAFLKVQSEELLTRLEELLKSENSIEPMSIEEFNKRIDKSLDDSNNENLISVNDLLKEIEKWH